MAQTDQDKMVRSLAVVIREYVNDVAQRIHARFATVDQRVDGVDQRVNGLEQRAMFYEGTWRSDQTYPKNTVVTDKGCLWIARANHTAGERPGHSPSWQMISKSQREAS